MSEYAAVLRKEDPRIKALFDVEAETLQMGAALIDDPFPAFARLLAQAPVHKGATAELLGYPCETGGQFHKAGLLTYTAVSFKAVSRGFIEHDKFSSNSYYEFGVPQAIGETIINKTGKEHRLYRDPIQPMFNPDTARTWWNETIIRETVDVLISQIEKKPRCDIFLDLCARMPVHVVSAGFGIPADQIISFRIALIDMSRHDASPAERQAAAQTTLDILQQVITARRAQPENDIISKLIAAEMKLPDGSKRPFTDEEIISHCRLIVIAGGGTTWRQLGITLFALLNNPEQFEAIKADRSLIPNAILEAARWHPTDQVFARKVEQDVELEGVPVPRGAILHLCLGAANRDPSRWENPERFDLHRPVQRALAFGNGPHSCLGQHVSRSEMEVAIEAMIDRLPNIRWDSDAPPARMVGGLFQRGPSALHIRHDA